MSVSLTSHAGNKKLGEFSWQRNQLRERHHLFSTRKRKKRKSCRGKKIKSERKKLLQLPWDYPDTTSQLIGRQEEEGCQLPKIRDSNKVKRKKERRTGKIVITRLLFAGQLIWLMMMMPFYFSSWRWCSSSSFGPCLDRWHQISIKIPRWQSLYFSHNDLETLLFWFCTHSLSQVV